jgi:hypothetical protein
MVEAAQSIADSLKRMADLAERLFPAPAPPVVLPCADERGFPCNKFNCPHCEVPF